METREIIITVDLNAVLAGVLLAHKVIGLSVAACFSWWLTFRG